MLTALESIFVRAFGCRHWLSSDSGKNLPTSCTELLRLSIWRLFGTLRYRVLT